MQRALAGTGDFGVQAVRVTHRLTHHPACPANQKVPPRRTTMLPNLCYQCRRVWRRGCDRLRHGREQQPKICREPQRVRRDVGRSNRCVCGCGGVATVGRARLPLARAGSVLALLDLRVADGGRECTVCGSAQLFGYQAMSRR